MNTSDKARTDVNRRDFLAGTSFATLATWLGGVELIAQAPKADVPTTYGEAPAFVMKCAVVGLGSWGREIIGMLSRIREAEVAVICDTYAPSLTRAAKSAPKAKSVAEYQQILEDKSVQAVFVTTPSYQHKDIVLAALKAGKHVYCEAPLAHTIEDTRAIAKAAQASPTTYFQAGLQMRSNPQHLFLLPFIRSNAVGNFLMTRAQWHKKSSWRAAASTPERDRELNWRLRRESSPGLAGEIGIHQFDTAAWFLHSLPTAVSGFGGLLHWNDGRDVPDTVQVVVEFPRGVNAVWDAMLGNSFDASYELLNGTDATVMLRENKAWLFKEVDSALLGWEVYARKENFYKETGIALVANASKGTGQTEGADDATSMMEVPLRAALETFLTNANEVATAVEDFRAAFAGSDAKALAKHVADVKLAPAAGFKDGYQATVMALKANEAILKGTKIPLPKELFELA